MVKASGVEWYCMSKGVVSYKEVMIHGINNTAVEFTQSRLTEEQKALNIAAHEAAHAVYAHQLGANIIEVNVVASAMRSEDCRKSAQMSGAEELPNCFWTPIMMTMEQTIIASLVGPFAESVLHEGVLLGEYNLLAMQGIPMKISSVSMNKVIAKRFVADNRAVIMKVARRAIEVGGHMTGEQFRAVYIGGE